MPICAVIPSAVAKLFGSLARLAGRAISLLALLHPLR